jgi:hypothetical protein
MEIEAHMIIDKEETKMENDESDIDEDTMQEMLNSLKESKKNRLH